MGIVGYFEAWFFFAWPINEHVLSNNLFFSHQSPNLVDVEEDLLNAVDIQEVPRTSEGLLAWAATRDWPVTSFTRAESANKFVVMSGRRLS